RLHRALRLRRGAADPLRVDGVRAAWARTARMDDAARASAVFPARAPRAPPLQRPRRDPDARRFPRRAPRSRQRRARRPRAGAARVAYVTAAIATNLAAVRARIEHA